MKRPRRRAVLRHRLGLAAGLAVFPIAEAAQAFALYDPFPLQSATEVAILEANHSADTTIRFDGVFENDLPLTAPVVTRSGTAEAFSLARVDPLGDEISVRLTQGRGIARVDTARTLDLPVGMELSGLSATGFRAIAVIQVWGASPDGFEVLQDPFYYGAIFFELQKTFESWSVDRWTWGGEPNPTVEELFGGDDLDGFDWSTISDAVDAIANGREIGHYEITTSVQYSGVQLEGLDLRSALYFSPRPVPTPAALPMMATAALAFPALRRLRRRRPGG